MIAEQLKLLYWIILIAKSLYPAIVNTFDFLLKPFFSDIPAVYEPTFSCASDWLSGFYNSDTWSWLYFR